MRERRFKIETNYTPATIPMLRLAEYMSDLAILLGEPKSVHFDYLEEGIAATVHRIDDDALAKVDERLERTRHGEGPSDAKSAADRINRRLREDDGSAVYLESSGLELIRFPGRDVLEPISFGAFNQQ